MTKGRIIKAMSGFYYVEADNEIYQCRGRGNFRKRKLTPLVGDIVEFEAAKMDEGYILELLPRKNELNRPPISNVDQGIIVFSAMEPDFNPTLLDRFLVHMEANLVLPIIVMTKIDLLTAEGQKKMEAFANDYQQIGYSFLLLSSDTGEGIEVLRPFFKGKISVFAGQSGVGKSSLLNKINPSLDIETGKISKSLGRGKHTTRHVELIPMESGYIADTPGFSSLEFSEMESTELTFYFPEMMERMNDCKFRGCTHLSEPGCAVKAAVDQGEITSYRYANYLQFLDEIKNQKRRY